MNRYDYKTFWTTSAWSPDPAAEGWFETIRPHLKGAKTVLDVGCGTGRFVPCFEGMKYTGVDISPLSLAVAKAEYPKATFIKADLLAYNTKKQYDVVFCWVTLQHIWPEEIEKVTKKLQKWGKKIIFGECWPNGENWEGHNFPHDYEKLFNIQTKEHISGPVYLATAKGEV